MCDKCKVCKKVQKSEKEQVPAQNTETESVIVKTK